MDPFKRISVSEKEALLKFPAYISLLAASCDDALDETEKLSAVRFVHTRTFSCVPLLVEFYHDADQVFEKNIDLLDGSLPKGKIQREEAIKKELLHLEKIVLKLGKVYALALHRSMISFKEHVSKAHNNVLVNFIFPITISGLSD